ncbi:MAG: RNA methyltransferase [Vallitaleaceae bacterium]|jgi:TrmH family RNA methyltransferase|nr:RNA methyltransferase [Vallitaleaceae bacterium]
MITSVQNGQIKRVINLQKKHKSRIEEKAYVVEGIKMVEEAPDHMIEKIFINESLYESKPAIALNRNFEVVTDEVMKKMADTVTPQGVMAIIKMNGYDFEKVISEDTCMIIGIDAIQDPGNLGTIIRTAEAIGATCIITSAGTVDAYNSKVLRSTMGAIYHMPLFNQVDLNAYLKELTNQQIQIYAAHLEGDDFYHHTDLTKSLCFLIGNEGHGLSKGISSWATQLVKLPMVGKSESLNASVAASLLMYEAYRQRSM